MLSPLDDVEIEWRIALARVRLDQQALDRVRRPSPDQYPPMLYAIAAGHLSASAAQASIALQPLRVAWMTGERESSPLAHLPERLTFS